MSEIESFVLRIMRGSIRKSIKKEKYKNIKFVYKNRYLFIKNSTSSLYGKCSP